MADSFSSTFANAVLNILNGTAPTTYANVFIGLFTGAPGASGTSNVSVGSTTRVSSTFGSAASGVLTLSTTPSWTNGGTTETITDLGFFSAATGGTFLTSMAVTSSQAWGSGNVLQLTANTITIPIAS
jgi:hypothetical protein